MAGKRKHCDGHLEEGEMQGASGLDPYRGLIRFKARKLAGVCSAPHCVIMDFCMDFCKQASDSIGSTISRLSRSNLCRRYRWIACHTDAFKGLDSPPAVASLLSAPRTVCFWNCVCGKGNFQRSISIRGLPGRQGEVYAFYTDGMLSSSLESFVWHG